MEIYDYFESLQRGIRQNHAIGFLEEPVLMQAWDDFSGLLRARVFFWDGSHLTIDEVITTDPDYPEIIRYAYTYVKDNHLVFRYDNAPHFREFDTFPHHKHAGPEEKPEAAKQPTLNQVFAEVEQWLTKS